LERALHAGSIVAAIRGEQSFGLFGGRAASHEQLGGVMGLAHILVLFFFVSRPTSHTTAVISLGVVSGLELALAASMVTWSRSAPPPGSPPVRLRLRRGKYLGFTNSRFFPK
jgi:hypothetical protein